MAVMARGKKKKPPTFHYLPKSRAQRLKKSWVEDHKLRSKWKAQKRREGLTHHTPGLPRENASIPVPNSDSDTSQNRLDKSPILPPSHDKQVLHDPGRIAHASKALLAEKADAFPPKKTSRHSPSINRGGRLTSARHEIGQPNMKLRMNTLLEKIKRDVS